MQDQVGEGDGFGSCVKHHGEHAMSRQWDTWTDGLKGFTKTYHSHLFTKYETRKTFLEDANCENCPGDWPT